MKNYNKHKPVNNSKVKISFYLLIKVSLVIILIVNRLCALQHIHHLTISKDKVSHSNVSLSLRKSLTLMMTLNATFVTRLLIDLRSVKILIVASYTVSTASPVLAHKTSNQV